MAQMVAEFAVDVAPLTQGVHLVDSNVLQLLGVLLQGVDQLDGFSVRVGHDDVRARFDVFEHRFRWRRAGENVVRSHRLSSSCQRGNVRRLGVPEILI